MLATKRTAAQLAFSVHSVMQSGYALEATTLLSGPHHPTITTLSASRRTPAVTVPGSMGADRALLRKQLALVSSRTNTPHAGSCRHAAAHASTDDLAFGLRGRSLLG